MKKLLIVSIIMSCVLFGCMKPYQKEIIEEIAPNETAFVVSLEGATKTNQGKFESIEYLETAKVATKRISIPTRWKQIERMSYKGEWIPTVKVIKINRSPITREWTASVETGTNKTNQAIWTQSKESIGFSVGIVITASILEEDASKFLYYFSGRSLENVLDENVRGECAAILSSKFSSETLDNCRNKVSEIMTQTKEEVFKSFKSRGITITTLGNIEGMTYENKKIQDIIDQQFESENAKTIATNKKLAQEEINKMNFAIAETDRKCAEEFAKAQDAMKLKISLEISKIQAEKWDGVLPHFLISGSEKQNIPFLMNLSPETQK